MTTHVERRKLSRRMVEPIAKPYFKFVAPNSIHEMIVCAGLFGLVVWMGWYFGV